MESFTVKNDSTSLLLSFIKLSLVLYHNKEEIHSEIELTIY